MTKQRAKGRGKKKKGKSRGENLGEGGPNNRGEGGRGWWLWGLGTTMSPGTHKKKNLVCRGLIPEEKRFKSNARMKEKNRQKHGG